MDFHIKCMELRNESQNSRIILGWGASKIEKLTWKLEKMGLAKNGLPQICRDIPHQSTC